LERLVRGQPEEGLLACIILNVELIYVLPSRVAVTVASVLALNARGMRLSWLGD
jgi:hypothetical protein